MGERRRERREAREESPYQLVTDKNEFEIIIPGQNQRVSLRVDPGGGHVIKIEPLTDRESEKIGAETRFTKVARELLAERLEMEAAQRVHADAAAHESAVDEIGNEFGVAVAELVRLNYSDKQIMVLVRGEGKMFSFEEHMGIRAGVVREQVAYLERMVSDIFRTKATASGSRYPLKN